MSSAHPRLRGSDEPTLGPARLDRNDPTVLREQVASENRRTIVEGEAGPGERTPRARDFAGELEVISNMVLRALRVLRDEGVVEMGLGRSIRVTRTRDRSAVALKLKELVELVQPQGYRRDALVVMRENLPCR
ncbi:MAG TPA: GntR family transcriptional regulator [Acidimicrobiales bacterium]|nr:GntR family transcriptional regulator [Acidimicrobiales bacterium]